MKDELKNFIFDHGKHLFPLEDFEIFDQLIDKFFDSYQPERLNPEGSIYYYVCLEGNDLTTSWDKIFETESKEFAQRWKNQKPLSRTWHEKIRVCDSPSSENKQSPREVQK